MPLKFNIRHLEKRDITLEGELPVAELDLENLDELVHVSEPLKYNLTVQQIEHAVLVFGSLRLKVTCECARCLKPYPYQIDLENWTCHLPLVGDEKAEVINDTVDLTPYLREDIVLAFPQQPLCDPECKGLTSPQKELKSGELSKTEPSPAWAELNKLKF
jgi:uncharacterized metal-binding protein YceD (DUF177 family)